MPESLVCRVSEANALGTYSERDAVRVMEAAGRAMRLERRAIAEAGMEDRWGEHRLRSPVFPPSRHNSSTIEPKSAAIEVDPGSFCCSRLPEGYREGGTEGREGQSRRSEGRTERESIGLGTRWSADSGGISTPPVFPAGAPAVVVTPPTDSVQKRLTKPFQRERRVHADDY